MKKVICFFILVVLVFAVSAANASGFWGVMFNAGTERDPIEATLVLTDSFGNVLGPEGGIHSIPNGNYPLGQIFINGATRKDKYEIKWSTMTLVTPENLRSTEFSPEYGWRFILRPEDYAQSASSGLRQLSIWIRAFGSKKDFVRVIFKITYNKSSVFTTSSVLLKTVSNATASNVTTGYAASSENLVKQDTFNKEVAATVNNLESRVSNLENWASSATDQTQNSGSSKFSYSFRVVDQNGRPYNSSYTLWVRDSSGERSFNLAGPNVSMLDALPGKYSVRVNNSSWIPYSPRNGGVYQIQVSSN